MLRILFCLVGATSYLAKLPTGYAYATVTSYVSIYNYYVAEFEPIIPILIYNIIHILYT